MSDYTRTPNYGLKKPVVDSDIDLWGDHLNQNADVIDTALWAQSVIPAPAGAPPPVSLDLDPARHLSNLRGKTSAVIAIIGDSTMTAGPLQAPTTGGALTNNSVDPTQTIWAMLCNKLKADNPQITAWTLVNFAIGGTNENHPIMTGTAIGVALPPWFVDPSQTWLSYVQTAAPDVLFWGFGTNGSTSGISAGSAAGNAASFIQNSFQIIDGWAAVPNIVIVTTKASNPVNEPPGGIPTADDSNGFARKAQAAWHRTFAQSGAAGFTLFPNVKAKGFGLLDLGRHYVCRVNGHDPASQGLRARPEYLSTTRQLGAGAVTGIDASTVGYTTHGDFRLTFKLVAAGGAYIFNLGGNYIRISVGGFSGNYFRLNIAADGTLTPIYVQNGTQATPAITGTPIATTAGQDIVVTLSLSGPRVQCTINGTVIMDTWAARFVSECAGKTPINVNFFATPTSTTPMHVTEFYEGVGATTGATMTYAQAFGTRSQGDATIADYAGGNAYNHQTSASAAADREVINAMNFAVGPAAGAIPGNATVSGGTLTLDNATSNFLTYRNVGAAAPSFTTRSVGTKIVLFQNLSGSAVDNAIGVGSNTLWFSVPNVGASTFAFYAGTTQILNFGQAPLRMTFGTVGTHNVVQITPGAAAANPTVIASTAGGGGITFNANTGFNNATPIAKPTITGSRGGNAALANLLTQLASYGLLTDGTTA